MCELFRFVCGHPLRIPLYRGGEVATLANWTVPILDHELFKCLVKKPELPARKDAKQVTIEIAEDLCEIQNHRDVTSTGIIRFSTSRNAPGQSLNVAIVV
jgi:hypothetical protein